MRAITSARLSRTSEFISLVTFITVGLVVLTKLLIHVDSLASGQIAFEAENGAVSGGAVVQNNSAASGGRLVAFTTAAAKTTPTPTPVATPAPYTVTPLQFGGACNGSHDDRAAVVAALQSLTSHGGGVLQIPNSTCRIIQIAAAIFTSVGSNITIAGSGSNSSLQLACDAATSYRELLRVSGSNITLRNLNLVRGANCTGVMLAIFPSDHLTLTGVTVDGRSGSFSNIMHGLMLGSVAGGVYKNISLSHVTLKDLAYGFFQDNSAATSTDGFTVDSSTFSGNRADDLEFNAPSGVMTHVTVSNSTFSNNLSTSEASGIGVGLANVQHAVIRDNSFTSYSYNPIHIENQSSDVVVSGNHIVRSFTAVTNYSSYILVINGSHDITIQNNYLDTSQNTNPLFVIYVGPGGNPAAPYNVTVTGNTVLLRSNCVLDYSEGTNIIFTANTVTQI